LGPRCKGASEQGGRRATAMPRVHPGAAPSMRQAWPVEVTAATGCATPIRSEEWEPIAADHPQAWTRRRGRLRHQANGAPVGGENVAVDRPAASPVASHAWPYRESIHGGPRTSGAKKESALYAAVRQQDLLLNTLFKQTGVARDRARRTVDDLLRQLSSTAAGLAHPEPQSSAGSDAGLRLSPGVTSASAAARGSHGDLTVAPTVVQIPSHSRRRRRPSRERRHKKLPALPRPGSMRYHSRQQPRPCHPHSAARAC